MVRRGFAQEQLPSSKGKG